MSSQLLSHSPDLSQLVEEGYELIFKSSMLLVGVPYVNRQREVTRGFIVSSLVTDGDHTASPVIDHTIRFIGATGAPDDQPCDSDGIPLTALMHEPTGPLNVGTGLVASCGFSQKPVDTGTYANYYDKVTTYAGMFLTEVHQIDPTARAQSFMPVAIDDDVHRYFDSATSRAKIGAVTDRTRGLRIAIVGLGGTGSYILDAVAKTHVTEIHLYDSDEFQAHNAFRAPGAAELETFRERPLKVNHHQKIYDALHTGVIAHPFSVDENSVEELRGLDFVFVSVDAGPVKKLIIDKLNEFRVAFVDTGMGIEQKDSSLGGIIRTTRIAPGSFDQTWIDENFSYAAVEPGIYDENIQVAELNMLNAALAVIAWKKHIGFYRDYGHEIEGNYTIDGNRISNTRADEHGED